MVVNEILAAKVALDRLLAGITDQQMVDRIIEISKKLGAVVTDLEQAGAAKHGSVAFRILGQPYSKANSRQIVQIGGRPSVIKSKEARDYEADALRQIPPTARKRYVGPVRVTLRIFYASERPDLDESVVLDVLQDRHKTVPARPGDEGEKKRVLIQNGIYRNDRQVREKHVFHGIDKQNPRCEILVEPLQPQQPELALPENEAEIPF